MQKGAGRLGEGRYQKATEPALPWHCVFNLVMGTKELPKHKIMHFFFFLAELLAKCFHENRGLMKGDVKERGLEDFRVLKNPTKSPSSALVGITLYTLLLPREHSGSHGLNSYHHIVSSAQLPISVHNKNTLSSMLILKTMMIGAREIV